MTQEGLAKRVKPWPKRIIIHSGTNDLRSNEANHIVELLIDISKVVKSISPGPDIPFSSIVKCSDDTSLNGKIHNVSIQLKKQCSELGYDFSDNNCINAVCLNQSGLHLNRRGDASLARNLNDHLFRSTNPVFDSAEIGLRNDSVEPENLQADIDKLILYDLDLQDLESFKKQHSNHPFLAYLNINSLRNKIIDLKQFLTEVDIEILVIAETELNDSLPNS